MSEKDPFEIYVNPGLTKRELFAAMAMQGLLSNSHYSKSREWFLGISEHSEEGLRQATAIIAIRHADSLIQELEKKK